MTSQELEQAKYECEEAVAEAGVMHTELVKLRDEVTELLQLLAALVYAQGGRVTLTRKMLEAAPKTLKMLTWTDQDNSALTLTVSGA